VAAELAVATARVWPAPQIRRSARKPTFATVAPWESTSDWLLSFEFAKYGSFCRKLTADLHGRQCLVPPLIPSFVAGQREVARHHAA